jgi:ABC-2 type transport system ATP-binding protein
MVQPGDDGVSAQTDSVIEFRDALKDYGGGKRIGPVNLEVKKGEVVGFLGPNGSGKTSCIRLILGLMRPSSGVVRVNGFDPVRRHVEALRHVAYSPELPNIQTFLSPRELLELVSHEIGIPSSSSSRMQPSSSAKQSQLSSSPSHATRSEEIRRVLELVGLSEYADTKVGKLSKGMVQRLSVAQALVGSPELLILDEPMIGLDPAGSAHFREVFRRFASENGGTVFMSSHIMSEVESLCTSVAIIHRGKIVARGPVEDVIRGVLNYSIVIVEADSLSPWAIQRIREVPGVAEVSNARQNLFEILVHGREDVRPAIAEIVVSSNAKLYSIRRAENMLERAYIRALGGKKDEEEDDDGGGGGGTVDNALAPEPRGQ